MGPIASLFGVGDVNTPDPGAVTGSAASLVQGLAGTEPLAYSTQAKFGPQYENLTLDEILKGAGGDAGLGASFGAALPWLESGTAGANTAQRAAQIGDVAGGGAAAAGAVRSINPGETNILDEISGTALSGLKAGTTLAPEDASKITSGVRANWASRGLGQSDPAQLDEALQLGLGGENILNTRLQQATGAANLESNLVTQPSLSFLEEQSNAPALAENTINQLTGLVGPSGPTLTDPMSVFNTAYNAQAAANIQSGNNAAGLMSY